MWEQATVAIRGFGELMRLRVAKEGHGGLEKFARMNGKSRPR